MLSVVEMRRDEPKLIELRSGNEVDGRHASRRVKMNQRVLPGNDVGSRNESRPTKRNRNDAEW